VTISEREIGELQQRLKQIEHQRRNDRTIINGLDAELNDLRSDIERLRTRIYATISSVAVFAAVAAWFIEFITG
jgi:predicted  nucleic acid-binding Zn-ribbon protein|tara:strand:- start:3545 stop:3766 length:222 start_codon:yes stop_codon:yes gene_type:complete